jgi:lipid II:glycine glycyltransferase (peptidoglycan interpeptide bridge formation enzyme)
MVASGSAFILLAGINNKVLAGGIFFTSGKKALYYHGCSSRDRKYTTLEAPTLLLFEGLRFAKTKRCEIFDWGGCSPNTSKEDTDYSVYRFKERWGGKLVPFYNGEYPISKFKSLIQNKILIPSYSKLCVIKYRLLKR